MPEGRILLKSISESKKLSKLKTDGARLLYSWLIPHLNINGCYSADPEVIKGKVLTRLKKSIKTVKSYLEDLEENELIIRYTANGDEFLIVPDFEEKQPSLNPKREAKPSIPLPSKEQLQTNSGVTPKQLQTNSNTSKVKQSKVKQSKDKVESLSQKNSQQNGFEKEFDELWKQWPSNGRFKKKICRAKFQALYKQGKLDLFKKVTFGYSEYLEAQRKKKNFDQRVMHLSTWLNNWEEERDQYENFKYKPPL